jgi:NADH-ubiquinone oxidoreductase chain 1
MYIINIINTLEVLLLLIPILLSVAFITITERKTMASMQRRLGPNVVGYYGLLQAFADALKLLIKEYINPTQANIILFFLGPLIALIFSLYGYAIIPFGPNFSLYDFNFGLLYILIVSSLSTYGILLAGWSANSKYTFLGSLRSTAQLLSYELILSSSLLIVVLLTGTLNLGAIIEMQKSIWLIFPLLPLFFIFFIACVAETNRAPFDLAEAESELVGGFMTEHSASIFVFFFLAEYASIVLISMLINLVLLGGYNMSILYIINKLIFNVLLIIFICIYTLSNIWALIMFFYEWSTKIYYKKDILGTINKVPSNADFISYKLNKTILNNLANIKNNTSTITEYTHITSENIKRITPYSWFNSLIENLNHVINNNNFLFSVSSFIAISIKSLFVVFCFIWVRASYPRIRYDQLMSYCWTLLLPSVIAIIIIIPCYMYFYEIIPFNTWLL